MQAVPVEALRADALYLALGVLFAAVGVLAIFVRVLRRRGDWSLLFFGIASALYGSRLLVLSRTAHLLYSGRSLERLEWTITFIIGIPFVLYFSTNIVPAWRKAVWATIALQVSLACFGIPAAYLGRGLEVAKQLNNILVLLFMPVLFLLVYAGPAKVDRDVRILRLGALIFGIFSIYTNLVPLGLLPGTGSLEPIGFVIFLGTLGYVSAHRAIRTEERLVSIQSELDIAQRIQSGLLPRQDLKIPHLEIATKYVPLSSVAGDFYDFLVDGSRTGVLIADVTGHGVPAALTASMVKVAIRAQASNAADPAQVLRGLNGILHGNLEGQFVTAAYVYFDPQTRKLAYSGAGHPPLLLRRRATAKVEVLESNGLFLGPFDCVEYPTLTTSFEPGDRCLLYTDGVLEAENPQGDDFGQQRLAEFLAQSDGTPGVEFCDRLLGRIQEWSQRRRDDEANDDITLIVIDCIS